MVWNMNMIEMMVMVLLMHQLQVMMHPVQVMKLLGKIFSTLNFAASLAPISWSKYRDVS